VTVFVPSDDFLMMRYWLTFQATLYLIVNIYAMAWNNSLKYAFNKKMANNLTRARIYMLVLEIVLVQLLLVCALALMCTL